MTFILLLFGLLLLLAGGTTLVRGASGIANQYGVSPLIVGLTVVSFGTSAPELVVNIIGAVRHETDLAFGNVVGSNLANLGLVLCTAAMIKPPAIQGQIVRRELPLLLLGTTILLVMTFDQILMGAPAMVTRSEGLVLLLLFSIFIYISISDMVAQRQDPLIENMIEIRSMLPARIASGLNADWVYVGFGIFCLGLGGHLTITQGVEFAHIMGLSPVVVGMIVVAIGTSLPELVTSVIAAMKSEPDLCVGNVIGSNLFNSLFVLPISAMITPLPIPAGGTLDILLTLVFTAVLLGVFLYGRATMDRKTAFAMFVAYLGYMILRTIA